MRCYLQVLISLLLLAACSGKGAQTTAPPEPPHVAAWKPGDELTRLDESLHVVFDRNMVSVESVGPVLSELPVKIVPELPLRVHWQERNVLSVAPETQWLEGERYTLSISPPLAAGLQGATSFTFDVRPLRVGGSSLSLRNVATTPRFNAYFSLPVDPEQVRSKCALSAESGERRALRVLPREPDASEAVVTFEVEQPLALATHYTLDCSGLVPQRGRAPLRFDPKAVRFRTHGLPQLERSWPEAGSALPPEKAELCLELDTPVETDQLAAHVHVSPEPEGLGEAWYEGPCTPYADDESEEQAAERWTHRKSSILLAPRTRYRVTVDAELRDTFDQPLGKKLEWEFETADRVPGLWTATGSGLVLERGRREHALGALNLRTVAASCLPLTAAQLVRGLDELLGWPSALPGDDGTEPQRAPWQQLSAAPRTQSLAVSASPNQAKSLPLDLAGLCGLAPQQSGVFALDLTPQGPLLEHLGRQGDEPARLLANVTDLALVAKRGAHSALVWVHKLSTGALVPGAEVELLASDGQSLAKSASDAQGLARFAQLPVSKGSELFSVRTADDFAVVATHWRWGDGLRPWQLDVREGESDPIQLFVHTDRGVYRPGETVYLHGLVREVRDLAPARIPDARNVHLSLSDGREKLLERDLPLSDFGSLATELPLSKQLAPGTYSVEVQAAGRTESYPLQLAEFRPLTFELSGQLAKPEVFAGQAVKLELSARYLFGAPLSAANVRFSVERSPTSIAPSELAAFSFADQAPLLPDEAPWPEGQTGLLSEQDEQTDDAGRARLQFSSEPSVVPLRYVITVAATDAANDRATRVWSLVSHSSDRYPGVRMLRSVYGGSEPVQAQVVLVDRGGRRVAGEADVELRRSRWHCQDPLQSCRVSVDVLDQRHISVSADAPAELTFEPGATGTLHMRVSSVDARGRKARASDSTFVWSQSGSGPYEDRVAAPLEVDRKSYGIGDVARLALRTALEPAQLLVTAERSEILQAQVIDRSAGVPSVTLDRSSAPNVFLGATGMTPRAAAGEAGRPRLTAGMKEVSVSGPSRALSVQIKRQRERYKPGEKVEGEVSVKHLGQPLLSEVALVAVNESVLQLTGFETPDPTRVFHAPRGLTVGTFSNIPLVIADPARAALVPETARLGVGGEDGPGGKPDVRNDYVAAAYVAPSLRTGADGRVAFSFPAPSDLSAYRLMAVVAARDDRVGKADARFSVSQPLAAHMIAPRFVSEGDSLELGALVHDSTEQPGPTEVSFTAHGLELATSRTQLTATASGVSARTDARVLRGDHASFEVELHKGAESDRIRHELVVRRPLDSELRVLALGRGPKAAVELTWPEGIDRNLSRLEISVDRAGLAPLAPLLAMVVDYPYGCTEQTAAALLAIASAPELASAVLPGLTTRDKLAQRIDEGIERLRAARAPDGQYGLYPGLPGRPWLTALVLESALAVKQAGFQVPSILIQDGVRVLQGWLAEQKLKTQAPPDLERTAQVLWLLGEAQAAPSGMLQQLLAERARLTTDGLAYALHAAARQRLPDSARAPLRQQLSAADWLARPRDADHPLSSAERTSALALSALQADGAAPEAAAKLAGHLVARAGDPDSALSTRDVADSLRALSSWARTRQAGANKLRVGLGQRVLFQGSLTGAQVLAKSEPAATAAPGRLWIEADGDVSFSVRRRDISPSSPKPAFAHGLSLERRYTAPRTGTPLTQLALGDIVQVDVELRTGRAARMLVISDPLPAGLEPLDPGLSSGRFAGCSACEDQGGFDFVRRRDDRIEAFSEWLPAGSHHLRYLLRATTAGSFSAPGAQASLMYMPDVYARSGVGQLQVTRP